LGLTGAGVTKAVPLSGNPSDYLQLYASVTDLSGLLAVNPGLKATTSSLRSGAVGSSLKLSLPAGTKVSLLNVLDAERGRFPFRQLASQGTVVSDRRRTYNVASVEHALDAGRLKADLSYSAVGGEQSFTSFDARTSNSYLYADVDFAGKLERSGIEYRSGISGERILLRSRGSIPVDGKLLSLVRKEVAYTSGYLYVTAKPWKQVSIAVGTRQPATGVLRPGSTYQATAVLETVGGTHRLIVGIGTYGTLILPEILGLQPLATGRSRQVSMDYRAKLGGTTVSIGLYRKADRVGALTTDIEGFDVSVSAHVGQRLTVSGSLGSASTRVRGSSGAYPSDNDLPYLARLSVNWTVDGKTSVNAMAVARSGTVFTPVVGAFPALQGGMYNPIFAPEINSGRLAPYRTVDLNVIRTLDWWPSARKPLGFVSIANALDRRNQARAVYSSDFAVDSRTYYGRRAITFGIVFQL
jgi:hypothetical protein